MVRYGKILADAWRKMWRSWAMWGWLALGYSAVAAAMALYFVTIFSAVGVDGPSQSRVIGGFTAMTVLGLFSGLFFLLYNGALVHMSNEGLEGRPVRFSDGWSAGWRCLPRVAALDLSIWLVGFLLTVVGLGVLFGFAAASGTGGDAAAVGFVGVFCCGYAAILVFGSAFMAFALAFEAIAVRAIVISGASVRGAMAAARDAIRHRFKNVFLMGLILVGIYYGMQMILSMLLLPFQLGLYSTMPDPTAAADPTAFLGSFSVLSVAMIVVSYVLYVPMMVFVYYVWTGFYRQLFGIDVPPTPVPVVRPPTVEAPEPAQVASLTGYEIPPPPSPPAAPIADLLASEEPLPPPPPPAEKMPPPAGES